MKKAIFLSLSLLIGLGFTSCSDTNEDTPVSITASANEVSLVTAGTASSIEVQTNGEILRTVIPANATWLHSVVDKTTITFDADASTDLHARSAEVKIMVGVKPNIVFTTVKVTQEAGDAFITPTTESNGMTKGTEAINYTIKTNYDSWTASLPDAVDWLTLTKTENTLTLTPTTNLTVSPRTATITIDAATGVETKSITFDVVQEAGDATLEITGTIPVELNDKGNAHELTIATNNPSWTATVTSADSDWCHVATSNAVLTITADAYSTDAIREATITLSAGIGSSLIEKTVTVKQQGKVNLVAISVPSTFEDSYVYKTSFAGDVIAWICKEYVASESAQKTVAYPLVNGTIQLDKGLILADDATAVYYQEGELLAAGTTSTSSVTVPLLLEDKRPGGNHNYKVVKIGDNLWMAENLQAKVYADGSAIEAYTDDATWTANTTGSWYLTSEEAELLKIDGLYYNGYVLTNESGIAPASWSVASKADYLAAKTLLGSGYGTKMKATSGWNGDTASNLSGFSAPATGFYSTATSVTAGGNDIYYWTSTSEKDWLSRKPVPVAIRFNYKSSGFSASTHGNAFGHCIRCVKSLK